MTDQDRWLLPEGIEELLPPWAERLERLSRALLDLYRSWGYERVMPPLIEYLESLLTGTGNDLDLQTFKLTDQLTGRLMGVRADITPQVARIDAHRLNRDTPTRLCYLDRVLRTRPEEPGGPRSPLQVGVELYGHSGIESDVEVLCLMLETLELTGVSQVHVDLGHVGIFRGLARAAGLDAEQEVALFDALQRKALPEIREQLGRCGIDAEQRRMLAGLAGWNGDEGCLAEAEQGLRGAGTDVLEALGELRVIATALRTRWPNLPMYFDLAELRGYHYQTGVVFAAFTPGRGQEVARGGRYDDIGRVFGRARAATGFSADLQQLMSMAQTSGEPQGPGAIFAPWGDAPGLQARVRELRAAGERVIGALPGQHGGAADLGCDRVLVKRDGVWVVELGGG
ncbi:MAG: ATP phosphoribosyltransferase regulatory subunit [Chromatiales bacterium 21-64-14]|nr:MAG: ATP phosphoribosyltransferase regulatory subunit [Chromatiales bacterium 21-64-14]HQU14734.1 ATP phosphoribosyltransferase regulatory subunit [Gammaproteobacteria bacterium]